MRGLFESSKRKAVAFLAALAMSSSVAAMTEEVEVDLTAEGEAFVAGCIEGGFSEGACVCLISYLIEDGVTVEDLDHIDADAYGEVLAECAAVN